MEARNLPIIFLITDGAVQNEHDICGYARTKVLGSQTLFGNCIVLTGIDALVYTGLD